jgi:hypothetical protein
MTESLPVAGMPIIPTEPEIAKIRLYRPALA